MRNKDRVDVQVVLAYHATTPDMAGYGCGHCGHRLGVRHGVVLEGIAANGGSVLTLLCLKCSKREVKRVGGSPTPRWELLAIATLGVVARFLTWGFALGAIVALALMDWRWMAAGAVVQMVSELVLLPYTTRLIDSTRE